MRTSRELLAWYASWPGGEVRRDADAPARVVGRPVPGDQRGGARRPRAGDGREPDRRGGRLARRLGPTAGAGSSDRPRGRSTSRSGCSRRDCGRSATAPGWRSTWTRLARRPSRDRAGRADHRAGRRRGRTRPLADGPAARPGPRRRVRPRRGASPIGGPASTRPPVAELGREPRRRAGRGRRAVRRRRRRRDLQRLHRARGARPRDRRRGHRRGPRRGGRARAPAGRPRGVGDGLPGLPAARLPRGLAPALVRARDASADCRTRLQRSGVTDPPDTRSLPAGRSGERHRRRVPGDADPALAIQRDQAAAALDPLERRERPFRGGLRIEPAAHQVGGRLGQDDAG